MGARGFSVRVIKLDGLLPGGTESKKLRAPVNDGTGKGGGRGDEWIAVCEFTVCEIS